MQCFWDGEIIDVHNKRIATYGAVQVTEKCRGVCIYIRDGLSFRECTNLNNSAFNESCWCILRLNSNEQILIGGIYRSPNCSAINSKKLLELINTAVNLKYDYTVLVGDFNYPNISWKDWTTPYNHTHQEFQFIECLRDNFMNQFISHPTRYREGQRANILDLFIVDKTVIVSKITYSSNLGSSDHVSFIAELNCAIDNEDSKTIKRNFYKGDYETN